MKLTLSDRYRDWCVVNHKGIIDDKKLSIKLLAERFDVSEGYARSMVDIYLSGYNGRLNEGKVDNRRESDLVPMQSDRVTRLERPMVDVHPIRTEYKGDKIVLTYDSRANYP
jgi:hypothetical protein